MKQILAHKSLNHLKAKRKQTESVNKIDDTINVCKEQQQILSNKVDHLQHSTAYQDLQKYRHVRKDVEQAILQEKAKLNSINHLEQFNITKIRNNERYFNNPNFVLLPNEKEPNDPMNLNLKDIESDNRTQYSHFKSSSKNKYRKNLKFGVEEPSNKPSRIQITAQKNIKNEIDKWHQKDKQAQVMRDWCSMNKELLRLQNEHIFQENVEKNHKERLNRNYKRLK